KEGQSHGLYPTVEEASKRAEDVYKSTEEPLKPATKVWNKETHKWEVVEGEVGETHGEIHEKEGIPEKVGEDGFVDKEGKFVDRAEGAKIAEEAGIDVKEKGELHSEDLIKAKPSPEAVRV